MFLSGKNHYTDYEHKIRQGIKEYLPGEKAQFKMAPVERPVKETDHKTKKAGVMLLLFPNGNEIATSLIQRQVYDGVHSGQISLPGGKHETQDEDLVQTALRETKEEISLEEDNVKILGKLSPLYIPVSNYMVQPVIGSLSYKPNLIPDIREVENIYIVNLKDLSDPSCIKNEIFIENDKEFYAPFYKINNIHIWGATAMILSEFLELHRVVMTNSFR